MRRAEQAGDAGSPRGQPAWGAGGQSAMRIVSSMMGLFDKAVDAQPNGPRRLINVDEALFPRSTLTMVRSLCSSRANSEEWLG